MYHRLQDHSKHIVSWRERTWEIAARVVIRRLRSRQDSALEMDGADRLFYRSNERRIHMQRVEHIRNTNCEDVVFNMADAEFPSCFPVTKDVLSRVVPELSWPSRRHWTSRNKYRITATLTTLLILRRLASPSRWSDLVDTFRKHPSHMSEIFREGLQIFLNARLHLLTGPLNAWYIAQRAQHHAECIKSKGVALDRCIGFMDGTVIGIARPGNSEEQNAAYNGHKRKHALKFQPITVPDGLSAACARTNGGQKSRLGALSTEWNRGPA